MTNTTKLIILAFFLLNFMCKLNAQTLPQQTDPDEIIFCGATPAFANAANINARLGGPGQTPIGSFPANLVVQCGYFRLYFEDLLTGSNYGFADPTDGPNRINTACQVFTYISSVIQPLDPNELIDIHFLQSAFLGGGAYANASPIFPASFLSSGGVDPGYVFTHINSGVDPDVTTYDGIITVDFTWPYLNTVTDFTGCQIDLFSVLLHEATHTLGWISLIDVDAFQVPIGGGTLQNSFSKYDYDFLYYGDIFTNGPFTKLLSPALTLLNTPGCLAEGKIWTYGLGVGSVDQPIASGPPAGGWSWDYAGFQPGRSLSHMDGGMLVYSSRGFLAPGFTPEYVMTDGYSRRGVKRRTYALQELRLLSNLGYNLYVTNNNTPPYSTKNVYENNTNYLDHGGLWAEFGITPDAITTNCNPVTIDLSAMQTALQLVDAENDPIIFEPGSIYNIRGCGNGGNNHSQLVQTSPSTIIFTPRSDFVGRAQFGFHLSDGIEKGQFVVYTIDVTADGCFNCPSNLIINGGYEEGTEVTTLANQSIVNSAVRLEVEGRYSSGRNFSDAHLGNYYSWNWYPGGGTIIRDSYSECPTISVENNYFGYYHFSLPTVGLFGHPNSTSDRFVTLSNDLNVSTLCSNVQNCHKYELSFDVNSVNYNAQLPITIGFTDDVNSFNNPVHTYNYSFSQAIPVASGAWNNVVIPFYYCGTDPSNYLNIEAPFFNYATSRIYIDNLQLIEVAIPALAIDAGPNISVTPICNTPGCTNLNVDITNITPDDERCGMTFLWSPATALSDPTLPNPVACPTSTTTYTVTVTDACGQTATDQVTVTVLPDAGCFSITQTDPPCAYAGFPVTYTITINNFNSTSQAVSITDVLPPSSTFVLTGTNPFPTNPTTVTLAPGPNVFTITGYFLEVGDCSTDGNHSNEITMVTMGGTYTSTGCACILQGCPMIMYGHSDCVANNPVPMELGVHTMISNVERIVVSFRYPDFISPPTSVPGFLSTTMYSSPHAITSVNMLTTPANFLYVAGVQYKVATYEVIFTSPVNVSPAYTFFTVNFSYSNPSGRPLGQNTFLAWVGSPIGGDYHTDVYVTGSPTTPLTPWTQGYHVFFSGCPDAPSLLDASFRYEQVPCTGILNVFANYPSPTAIHTWQWGQGLSTPLNGAQNASWDYLATHTDNFGVSQTGAPGTYTLIHTVIDNGVFAAETLQVVIVGPCCTDPDYKVMHNEDLSSTQGSGYSGGTIEIEGTFYIDNSFTIDGGAHIIMEPGAKIVVLSGGTLVLQNVLMNACTNMYEGIILREGGSFYGIDATIEDADIALFANDKTTFDIRGCNFNNNNIGVKTPVNPVDAINNIPFVIYGCEFSLTNLLKGYYTGQQIHGSVPFAGIVFNNMLGDIGGVGKPENYFENLNCGIVSEQSSLNIRNCKFENIIDEQFYAIPYMGSAIYSKGGKGSFNILFEPLDAQSTAYPTVHNCGFGIYMIKINSITKGVRMDNVGKGAFITKNTKGLTTNINQCNIFAVDIGAHLFDNAGSGGINIVNNNITTYHDKGYGILAEELTIAKHKLLCANNVVNSWGSYVGIRLINSEGDVVQDNLVTSTYSSSQGWIGINQQGCALNIISCNEVTGSHTDPDRMNIAIKSEVSDKGYIACNTTNETYYGIEFDGVNASTDLKANQLNHHGEGLHINSNGIIGTQQHRANSWNGPFNSSFGANNLNSSGFGLTSSQFEVNTSSPPINPTIPGANAGWFILDPGGVNAECKVDDCHKQTHEGGGEGDPISLERMIANGQITTIDFLPESQEIAKEYLYERILRDSTLLDDSLFAAFFTSHSNLPAGIMTEIKMKIDYLKNYDHAYIIAHESIDLVIKADEDSIHHLDSLIILNGQSTTYTNLIDALRNRINTNQTALITLENLREQNLTSYKVNAISENYSSYPSELPQINEKRVNEIYLYMISESFTRLDQNQVLTLYEIAHQCPYAGGKAVYQARTIYKLVNESEEYDDLYTCATNGIYRKATNSVSVPINNLNIFPNPTTDIATINFIGEQSENCTLEIFSIEGEKIQQIDLPCDKNSVDVSTSEINAGIYIVKIYSNNMLIGLGKLGVVH